jgi:general secretion pathway protein H
VTSVVRQDGRGGAAGFTLLEILIVLVIVAMAATLVAPAVESGLRARLVRGAVRRVAGAMRTLQATAVQSGSIQHMVLDPLDNAVHVSNGSSIELGDVVALGDIRGGELLPGGVVRVNFYPNGSNTGVDVLLGERGVPANHGFVVHADPLVGLVTIVDPAR